MLPPSDAAAGGVCLTVARVAPSQAQASLAALCVLTDQDFVSLIMSKFLEKCAE